jgi:hypothetical protein
MFTSRDDSQISEILPQALKLAGRGTTAFFYRTSATPAQRRVSNDNHFNSVLQRSLASITRFVAKNFVVAMDRGGDTSIRSYGNLILAF